VTDLRTPPIHDGGLFPARVREYAYERPLQRLSILDAGCGWSGEIDLGDDGARVDFGIAGVDDDVPALRARTEARCDLESWQLGDLRTVPMPPRVYDVVRAFHLIERVPHAELVLDRFVAALKPGGLMVLRFRDRDAAFGYLDRRLPPWLRHLLWRHEHAPPAVYDRVVSLEGMRWYSMMRGLVISEEHTSRDTMTGIGRPTTMLLRVLSLFSRNRLTSAYSEVTLVIRKPENRFARII
jgi:SAM-dependent methyltransferase